LETAEKLGAEINLAFGKKCMGRLYRLDAERFPAGNERNQRLYQSVGLLEDAIECFSRLPEYGPDHPEVGDCYSLLGRTYLAFGRLTEADKAVRQAETRLRDPASKDYLDLQILLGDLEAVRSSYDNADRYYRQVTDREGVNDPERSEMRARAYLQRGRNALRQGHRPAATAYLKRAAEIWHSLGEPKAAAEAELELLNLESPPDDYLQAVQGKPAYVRVEVWKRDEKRRLEAASARNARRNEPPRSYWAQLVRQVEGDAAVNMIEW
ncbi:MAG TPA: tetratricopeptide repeat protein, partial [Longimicrobiaceae bacterium]|nr:tetratricopeptide repeat protein [Longimicrobiaceae bacterium]